MLRPLSSDPSPGSAVEFEIIVPSTTCNNTYIEMPFIESVFKKKWKYMSKIFKLDTAVIRYLNKGMTFNNSHSDRYLIKIYIDIIMYIKC